MKYIKIDSGIFVPESHLTNESNKDNLKVIENISIKEQPKILIKPSLLKETLKSSEDIDLWVRRKRNFFWIDRSFFGKLGMGLFLVLIYFLSLILSFNLIKDEFLLVILIVSIVIFYILIELTESTYRNINIAFSIAYGTIIVLASSCFIRVSLILPEFLKNMNARVELIEETPNILKEDMKLLIFFNSFIFTVPMLIIFFFLVLRVFLMNYPTAIKYWNNTLICWGVFFTIFTTISSQWI